ncbi:MAG: hypothetical protein WA459_14025 [Stellaceae bacterium]
MTPEEHRTLREAIGAIDLRLRALTRGVELTGPDFLERVRLRAVEMRRQRVELEETKRDADRLLPEMLDLYINGVDADREALRDVLREHHSFRWGVGWGLTGRIAIADDARARLAVFSMKDGGSDYRDQILALDHICAVMQGAGLPIAALLGEAADWSSDVARFPPARSTRSLLLQYAHRFAR